MAVASTTPELFTNLISTFIADSDMGLGTIIGSMMFNTLGVAGCAGLAAIKPVQLDWYPMARDCMIYSINIVTLVLVAWDGQVMWWETIILFVFFIFYFLLLSQNTRLERMSRFILEEKLRCCKLNSYGKIVFASMLDKEGSVPMLIAITETPQISKVITARSVYSPHRTRSNGRRYLRWPPSEGTVSAVSRTPKLFRISRMRRW